MLDPAEKLKLFTAAIEADAQAESERILSEVKQELASATLAAEDSVLNEAFRYIKNRVSQERTEMGRKVSRHMMDRKNALNTRREEMATSVMEQVRVRLADHVKTDAYYTRLLDLAKEMIAAFDHQELQLFLCPADMDLVVKLQKALTGEPISFKEGNFEMGGLMAVCPVTHRQIDESFDTKFKELRGQFAELFGLQLSQ